MVSVGTSIETEKSKRRNPGLVWLLAISSQKLDTRRQLLTLRKLTKISVVRPEEREVFPSQTKPNHNSHYPC